MALYGKEEYVINLGGNYISYEYDGISFLYDGNIGEISQISMASGTCTMNGVTLDKSRTELIAIFGEPDSEESNEDGYVMVYSYNYPSMQFTLDSRNGKAVSIMID